MQYILQKKKTRVLSAILIAALVLTMGMIVPTAISSPGSESHAATGNTSTVTVTLVGAKATQYIEYAEPGDYYSVYDPTGNDIGYTVTAGSVTAGQPLPYKGNAYDSATLYAWNDKTESWRNIASDSLYDYAAYEAADRALRAAYPSPTDKQEGIVDNALYAKKAFTFKFDSKYLGKKVTIAYNNRAQTRAQYGNYADQVLGGYFGDISDYAYYKTPIQTFTLKAGFASYNLQQALYETVKVTPLSAPFSTTSAFVNTAVDKYTRTYSSAYLILSAKGGGAEKAPVNQLGDYTSRYNKVTKGYDFTYLFSNPKAGTYVYPALKDQRLIFSGSGYYRDGTKDAKGNLKPAKYYQDQWLGGYKSSDIVGNPATVKKVLADKTKAVGSIALSPGTASIKGVIAGNNDISGFSPYPASPEAHGVVKDQKRGSLASGNVSAREPLRASFAEFSNYRQGKTKVYVYRELKPTPPAIVYGPATEAEYIAYMSFVEESISSAYPYVVNQGSWVSDVEITKAVYDTIPDYLYITYTLGGKYYKENYTYQKYDQSARYDYWKPSLTYVIENLTAGVYFVSFGGQVKVITVKAGKAATANFKDELQAGYTSSPYFKTQITGKKAKNKKLTATSKVVLPGFGSGSNKYKYYWTDGTKIIGKKAVLKVKKAYVKKNLWLLTVGTYNKEQSAVGWDAAPGNLYGKVGFDIQITGTFKKGKKLKATIANAQVSGVKYTYQWLRNGKAIKKAKKATYKLTAKDKGKKISVKVTGTAEGYTKATIKSKATKVK
jgi:hypothetical protein